MFGLAELETRAIAYGALVLALLGAYAWWSHSLKAEGAAQCKAEVALATAKAASAAQQTEANWQTNLEAQNDLDQEARSSMAADYARGLAGLRDRAAARVPQAAGAACAGASPAQLAAPDAAVALGIGSSCRAVQLDLEKARGWIETVTAPVPTP